VCCCESPEPRAPSPEPVGWQSYYIHLCLRRTSRKWRAQVTLTGRATLEPGDRILLSNLQGMVTAGATVTLTGSGAGLVSHAQGAAGGSASWNATTHALEFHLVANMEARRTYVMQLNVANPALGQDAPDLYLEVLAGYNSSAGPILTKRRVGSQGGGGKASGDFAPLAVAGFFVASISQSTQSAAAVNRLTLVLSCYTTLHGQSITISGFRGAYRQSARVVLRDESGDMSCGPTALLNHSTCHMLLKSEDKVEGEATWNGTLASVERPYRIVAGNKVGNFTMTGELRAATAKVIAPRQMIRVSFEVNNSAFGQSPPVIGIYHGNASVVSSTYNMTQPQGYQTVGFEVACRLLALITSALWVDADLPGSALPRPPALDRRTRLTRGRQVWNMDAMQALRIAGFGYTLVSQTQAASTVINTLKISFFNFGVMRAAIGTRLTISGLVGTGETEEASGSRILEEVPVATSTLGNVSSAAGPFVLAADISKASAGAYPVGYSLQIRSERRVVSAWHAASRTVEVDAAYSFLPAPGETASVRADFNSPFGNVGEWNGTLGKLVLNVQADSLAEVVYTFQFQVRNPGETSDAVDVYASSSGTVSPRWLLVSAPGRYAPLMVLGFVFRHIGQSSAKPGAVNTLTVTISATDSFEARQSHAIRILGLTGTSTGTSRLACNSSPRNSSPLLVRMAWRGQRRSKASAPPG